MERFWSLAGATAGIQGQTRTPCRFAAQPGELKSPRSLRCVEQEDSRGRTPLIERVRARQARHRQRNRIYRVAFAVVGFAVLLAGVIMLVTPGPGLAVILLGLGMLALEFAWAERWLERVLTRAEAAVDHVAQGPPWQRAAVLALGAASVIALATIVILWDLPYLPG
jgi:uncharacterized protein (TIGR02611 family)